RPPPTPPHFPYTTLFRSENHPAGKQPGDDGDRKRNHGQKMRMAGQQIAGAAKPGKERHDRGGVEPGDLRAGTTASVQACFREASDRKSTRLNSSHVKISY